MRRIHNYYARSGILTMQSANPSWARLERVIWEAASDILHGDLELFEVDYAILNALMYIRRILDPTLGRCRSGPIAQDMLSWSRFDGL